MQRTPLLLLLCVAAAATAMSTTSTSTTTTTTQSPREHRAAAAEVNSKEITSKIVKKLKTLAEHHQLPKWMQQQLYPLDDNLAVSSYAGHNIHVIKEPVEPSLDTSIYSATGYHMKGMLGFVEYLILLILLKGSIDHVAARFKASLKAKEPLVRNDRDLRNADPTFLTELSQKIIPHLN